MSEQFSASGSESQGDDRLSQIYGGNVAPQNTEAVGTSYSHVEHVPKSFENNPDVFKLQHIMEIDADNTIVLVGEDLSYLGGQLSHELVPHLEVPAADYFHPQAKVSRSVKAIKEDSRTIAFAVDAEKAMLYIGKRTRDMAVV